MQSFNKFHLEFPLVTDEIVAKATLILTMLGHKIDETSWEIESYGHTFKAAAPRVRCLIQNCTHVFGLMEMRFPRSVKLIRYFELNSDKIPDILLLIPGPSVSLDQLRATVKTHPDFNTREVEQAYCVRYRNLR